MKIVIVSMAAVVALGTGVLALADDVEPVAPPSQEQREARNNSDAEELYNLVKQARAELREMRVDAGLNAHAPGPRAGWGEGKGHGGGEGSAEHGGREGGERRGEHGVGEGGGEGGEHGGRERGGRGEGGEDGSTYLAKMAKQNKLFANGARLALQFNPNTQVFVGSVTNTTARTLSQVRVEIHLDNGTELGPTKRTDVGPGETIPVELGAFGHEFTSWISHPEAGIEQGHAVGEEESGEGRGEHGGEGRGDGGGEAGEQGGHGPGGDAGRPTDAAYRPMYNQLQILRGEMHAFQAELKARSTGGRR